MKTSAVFAAAVLVATIAPLGACKSQNTSQPNTSPLTGAPGAEKLTTQLKSSSGSQVANATFDFATGYTTVTVEAGPNQVLSPGFHGLQVHSVGKCEANSAAPTGGSTGDFNSAGDVYQATGHSSYPASGELTALQVRPDGSAKLVTTTASLTAADLRSSSGTALIVYQDPDNFGTSSSGNSGKRIACGVISPAATTTTSVSTVTTTVAVPPPSTSTSTSTVTVTSNPTVTSTPITTVTTSSLPPSSRPPGG